MGSFIRKYNFILLILIVAFVLRALFINYVAPGIGNDEMDFLVNAKAVWYHFSDIAGVWNPLSFTTIPYEQPKSEILYLLLAPFIGPFSFSVLIARIPFILANIGLVALLYLIIRKIIGERAGIAVAVVAALNPWFIFFSRTSYEAPIAIFFYFLGFYFYYDYVIGTYCFRLYHL